MFFILFYHVNEIYQIEVFIKEADTRSGTVRAANNNHALGNFDPNELAIEWTLVKLATICNFHYFCVIIELEFVLVKSAVWNTIHLILIC